MSVDELTALRLSLTVALTATLLCTPPAVLLGWVLARWVHPLRTALEAVVMSPLVLPPVVTGYLLLFLLGPNGPLGAPLQAMGLQLVFTTGGAIIAAAVVALPLYVRAARQAFEAVDPAIEEAAMTLGAGRLRVFTSVTLRIAAPGLITGALLGFARALGEFGATITFAGSIEGSTRTLPLAIFHWTRIPGGEASAARLVLLSLALALAAIVASEWVTRRSR